MSGKSTSILIGVLVYVFGGVILQLIGLAGMSGAALGCLLVLGSAMAAVWHHTSTNAVTIPAGEGAGMGALVGLAGAIIGGILGYILISMGAVPDPMDLALEQMREQGLTEEQIEQGMGFAESMSSPIVGIIIGSIFGAIGGAIGGAVGASVFKKGGAAPVV